MLTRIISGLSVLCAGILSLSCGTNDTNKNGGGTDSSTTQGSVSTGSVKLYDLKSPQLTELPAEMAEISGLSYNEADSSLYAISDDNGFLYRVDLKNGAAVQKWQFHKKKDFEDLYYLNGKFYIQDSNGDMYVTPFDRSKPPPAGTDIPSDKHKWTFGDNHELESLYYDDQLKNWSVFVKIAKAIKRSRSVFIRMIRKRTPVPKIHLR